jgi:hypothetical protein
MTVLHQLERHSQVAVVRFIDGEVYSLRIISTMHAEEGEDVVAEVVGVESKTSNSVPDGAFIDFHLADVNQIMLDGVCVFGRSSDS